VFAQRSAGFEELVGDYSALPSTYLPEDYARDTQGLNVVGTVWAEFISDNPADEVRWANELMHAATRPTGMIALVDFLSPDLKHTLDAYASTQHVRCVRQHMGWHPENPLLRYAQRPDLLSDPAWRRGIDLLRGRGLLCEIEIFAPQLREFASVAAAYPLDARPGAPVDPSGHRDFGPRTQYVRESHADLQARLQLSTSLWCVS
jgi:predicted TIM-barrel fold metal-dependent hydrolase